MDPSSSHSEIISNPLQYLKENLYSLPPSHLSPILTPKLRTQLPQIRNRRLRYTLSNPRQLSWARAKNTWPLLWEGRLTKDVAGGEEEKDWVKNEFLGGRKPFVGNLGGLLGDYEDEREAERVRSVKRAKAERDATIPEEEEDSEDDDELEGDGEPKQEEPPPSDEELKLSFERLIRERFIYGLLDNIDYDLIDWDDKWDDQNRFEDEERWFDEEEEN